MALHSSLVSNKSPIKSGLLIFLFLLSSGILLKALFSSHPENSRSKSAALVESYRAEMLIRMADALVSMPDAFSISQKISSKKIRKNGDSLIAQAQREINKAVVDEPNDPVILSKKIILMADLGQDISPELARLAVISSGAKANNLSKPVKKLAYVMQSLYSVSSKSVVPIALPINAASDIEQGLSPGWYRDEALLTLYKASGQSVLQKHLQSDIQSKTWRYVSKIAFLSVAGILAAGIGVIVILYQLLIHKEKKLSKQDVLVSTEKSEVSNELFRQTDWQTVVLIFGAWFFTQVIVAFGVNLLKQKGISFGYSKDLSLPSALSIAFIYLLSNGPAIFYIYFLALKPNQLGLAEGLSFHSKNAAGKIVLIMIGILGWFAALPIVMVAYLVATTFFNSAGSSNPIIGIVMEAAQAHDFVTIILFYMTLGILAPICEESLFRGFLYKYLRGRIGSVISNIVSSTLFAAAHMDIGAALPLFCLGSIFAYVFERSNSIWPAMITHGLWNSVTFTLILLLFSN